MNLNHYGGHMQKDTYLNGMRAGKAARLMIIFFSRIKHKMLLKAGNSKLRRILASMLFFSMIIVIIGLIASFLYYALGAIGPLIFLCIALFLPKVSSSLNDNDDATYSFNDGYRDGPEGYGYYSGGYKSDD